MSFFPIPIPGFGGLNLTNDPGDVGFGGAVDLANTDFERGGRIRSRSGYTAKRTTTGTPTTLFYSPQDVGWFTAESGDMIRAYDTGIGTYSAGNFESDVNDFVTFPGSGVHAISTNATGGLITFSGGVFSTIIAKSGFSLAVTPWDNRLVISGYDGHVHRLQFSNAGDPTTYGANNWVDVIPGGTNGVYAVRSWGNLIFAFKEASYAVFYGTSTDSTGNPIFNYRSVDSGGLGCITYNAAVAGREGVYFVGRDGVYLTTGGPPKKISGAIDPIFSGESVPFFTGAALNTTTGIRIRYVGGRLFIAYNTDSTPKTLVYYPWLDAWSYYDWGAKDFSGVDDKSLSLIASTTIHTHAFAPTYTTDNGSAITSRYQSGFEHLAPPRRYIDRYGFGPSRKRIRAWRVKGSGTVTMAVAADFGSTVGSTALTLGTAPAVAEARYSRAIRGAKISYKLSGTTAWTVNEMVAFLADTRGVAEDISGDQ